MVVEENVVYLQVIVSNDVLMIYIMMGQLCDFQLGNLPVPVGIVDFKME